MITVNPDKAIRKAVYTAINGIVVNGKTVKCYDSRVTGASNEKQYILLSSQNKSILKGNKCYYSWETGLVIDIFVKFPIAGNTGSRVLLNDIEQEVYVLLNNLVITGFENITQNVDFVTNFEDTTATEIIYRSIMRLNLTLK
jgi:hypothetical protein